MKIKERLIVAFLVIILCPLVFTAVFASWVVSQETKMLLDSYGVSVDSSGFITNPTQLLFRVTSAEFKGIRQTATDKPDKLLDREYLKKIDDKLRSCDSYIVVNRGSRLYFVRNKKDYEKISYLPGYGSYHSDKEPNIFLDQSIPAMIRVKDFTFSDGTQGQVFLVAELSKILPLWSHTVNRILLACVFSILITAFLLIIWLYNSIAKPVSLLRAATASIGSGNLDEPIQMQSMDELGLLYLDFEEMRLRLKDMIDERMDYEQQTRDMITNMAHDLQTPLTSIKGYTEGLMEGIANTPEKQMKYLRTIHSKAEDMSYLIGQLSTFAKVEQNSVPYRFLDIDLEEYLQALIQEMALDLEARHAQIRLDYQCRPGIICKIDPDQMKRVISNIVNNALKYSDKDHCQIRVTVRKAPIPKTAVPVYRQIRKDGSYADPEVPEQFVQISISDNGPGIDPKDLPYIFHRFYRADASRNSLKRGSGLGLAIVERIINDHGGKIHAESKPGEGTKMIFTLKIEDHPNDKED